MYRGYLDEVSLYIGHLWLQLKETYFPLLEIPISQCEPDARQLSQGCFSTTLHLTRRALQVIQALFARVLVVRWA